MLMLLLGFYGVLLGYNWFSLIFAAVLAIVVGLIIKYLYEKFSSKSKISQSTMSMRPKKFYAKFILPNSNECIIQDYERVFGREDFIGVILSDELLFIGKKHFKIVKMEDGFYIEDLNTKNGTKINGEEIKGLGKIKLRDGDEILLGKTLNLKYYEKNSSSQVD
jgi:pSer/pThr/pTyr-binding forkhead associated (FHA) protein